MREGSEGAIAGGRDGTEPPPSAVKVFRNDTGGRGGTGPPPSANCVWAGLARNPLPCCERSDEDRESKSTNMSELGIRMQSLRRFILCTSKLEFGLPSPVESNGSTKRVTKRRGLISSYDNYFL